MTWGARTLLALLALSAGCARSEQTIDLKAAFSDDTIVGHLRATWSAAQERTPGGGAQRAVTVRIAAVNLLADRLYLRVRGLRLIGPNEPIGLGPPPTACTLPAHGTSTVLQTTASVPAAAAAAIRGVDVEPLAIPLSERGRAFYREFLLRKRGGPVTAIDAELDAYAAAPPCPNP
jgi:hypothetical protein